MKIRTIALLLLASAPCSAWADDFCESGASLRARVTYCFQNFEYTPAARKCTAEYQAYVATEKKRLEETLSANLDDAADSAQKQDFHTTDDVLKSSLEDLDYLLDYGKQVHTEIEDYVYDLIIPVYGPEDENPDLSKPDQRAKFMSRECYGDPVEQMEEMEKSLEPMIQDLENTRAKVASMMQKTEAAESRLNASHKGVTTAGVPALKTEPPRKPATKTGSSVRKDSTITGDLHRDALPPSKP